MQYSSVPQQVRKLLVINMQGDVVRQAYLPSSDADERNLSFVKSCLSWSKITFHSGPSLDSENVKTISKHQFTFLATSQSFPCHINLEMVSGFPLLYKSLDGLRVSPTI